MKKEIDNMRLGNIYRYHDTLWIVAENSRVIKSEWRGKEITYKSVILVSFDHSNCALYLNDQEYKRGDFPPGEEGDEKFTEAYSFYFSHAEHVADNVKDYIDHLFKKARTMIGK